jgi:hypothetical protein
VRRALTWLAGAVGLAALARLLSRRRATVAPAGADPADELRQKLADRRRDETEVTLEEIVPEPEPDPAPDPQPGPVDLEERRARVHARAQEAIELMSDGAPTDEPDGDATA